MVIRSSVFGDDERNIMCIFQSPHPLSSLESRESCLSGRIQDNAFQDWVLIYFRLTSKLYEAYLDSFVAGLGSKFIRIDTWADNHP